MQRPVKNKGTASAKADSLFVKNNIATVRALVKAVKAYDVKGAEEHLKTLHAAAVKVEGLHAFTIPPAELTAGQGKQMLNLWTNTLNGALRSRRVTLHVADLD